MNPLDSPYGPTPRHTEIVPAPAAPGHGYDLELAAHDAPPAGKKITIKLVARAIRRYWWQAVLIWIVGSAGLMTLAYFKVKPTFAAFSQVKVEPAGQGIFGNKADGEFGLYKETQVNIITSPTVIDDALVMDPKLLTLERFRGSEDIAAELRGALNVAVVKNTHLIQIETACESPHEAAFIVNSVVRAYLKRANDANDKDSTLKLNRLLDARRDREAKVSEKRARIREQQEKFGIADITDVKNRNMVSVEQYKQLSSDLMTVETEIDKAEARLLQLQAEPPGASPQDDPKVLQRMVKDLFEADPRVAALFDKRDRARDNLLRLKQTIRDPTDPAMARHTKDYRSARDQIAQLREQMEPDLIARVQAGVRGPGPDTSLRDAEARVAELKASQNRLNHKLDSVNVLKKAEGAGALAVQFDQIDLARDQGVLDTIDRSIADLEFESHHPLARINLQFEAKPSPRATSNRLKMMAIAPVGMLFGVLALMVLLELHAGRVVDPDELTSRVRVPVVGIVPPLPKVRQQGALFSARDEFRAQRQLDQFVQSLDHLRVALCSSRDAWGRERRCILITSACGSEGKTTLAAQLAERCVNAGLRTLLIDGDLRNPTLTRMLDVPDHRGLINVLRGEVLPDEAMSVVGGGGGFHFMPSGTPKVDPSRLLHGDRLGKLLTQARESFDIVIVDAPPVLPVPDALTIGRWCDGAVLAVRCDTSRFALVEKANRRLATVGVTVIGAVVNGVKVAESTYGSYYPSYTYAEDRTGPLDV
jgi:capsular exopolysaccharide synthesis family protein